jgi:hypothetical protein
VARAADRPFVFPTLTNAVELGAPMEGMDEDDDLGLDLDALEGDDELDLDALEGKDEEGPTE